MAENDAGQGLDLDVGHGRALCLGEVADLLSCAKLDDLPCRVSRLGSIRASISDSCFQAEGGRRVVVEFLRQIAHGRIATGFDVCERFLDNAPHLGVVLGPLGLGFPAFQILNRHVSILWTPAGQTEVCIRMHRKKS